MQTKKCTKCKQEKPLDHFVKHVWQNNKRSSRCRDCINEFVQERAREIRKRKEFEII
jgi:NAD-dependent SIR2 family protein deacetylase